MDLQDEMENVTGHGYDAALVIQEGLFIYSFIFSVKIKETYRSVFMRMSSTFSR